MIGSEQVFPKADTAEIVVAGGRRVAARLAGRDRGTNIVALRLESPIEVALPAAAEPLVGTSTVVVPAVLGFVLATSAAVQPAGSVADAVA